jgi:ankyrin repeat protein
MGNQISIKRGWFHISNIVLQLLDKKVNTDVNKCRDDGTSPLYIACQNGHLDIVLQLLDKKVNTDVNKCTNDDASTCLHLY